MSNNPNNSNNVTIKKNIDKVSDWHMEFSDDTYFHHCDPKDFKLDSDFVIAGNVRKDMVNGEEVMSMDIEVSKPAMVWRDIGTFHYVISHGSNKFIISDPAEDSPQVVPLDDVPRILRTVIYDHRREIEKWLFEEVT